MSLLGSPLSEDVVQASDDSGVAKKDGEPRPQVSADREGSLAADNDSKVKLSGGDMTYSRGAYWIRAPSILLVLSMMCDATYGVQ